jgi:thioredoxin 1
MTELDKDTFDQAVLAHKGVYLVDFWSETCETCAAMMPEIETLERELAGEHALAGKVAFGKVNLQGNRRLAIREKVMSLPTVVVYRDGEKVKAFSKEFTAAEVKAAVEGLLGG